MAHKSKLDALRRKLQNAAKEVECIRDKGHDASTDSQHKTLFEGMFRALDRYYTKFESIWEEMLDCVAGLEAKESSLFPTDTDKSLFNLTRKHYYEANAYHVHLTSSTPVHPVSSGNNTTVIHENKSDLPTIPLPSFDGELLKWPHFRDTFKSLIIEEEGINAQRKFIYLKSALSGQALAIIANLPVEQRNFGIAWKALETSFDNKRMLATAYLNQLLNFKPIQGNPNSTILKDFLTKVSDSVSAFRLLQIPDESQFILFFLAMRCLDSATREKFEMSHKNSSFPTFDELTKFIRGRITALDLVDSSNFTKQTLIQQSNNQKQGRAQNYAKSSTSLISNTNSTSTKSSTSSTMCVVCKSEHHHLYRCAKFLGGSVSQRIEWLKSFNGCRNCLCYHHKTFQCTSKFSCKHCRKRHNSLLHIDNTSSIVGFTLQSKSSELSSSNSLESCSLNQQQFDVVVLGTALAEIKDARSIFQPVRLVVDCGSQHSFVTQACLKRLGLTPAKFKTKISGIGQTAFEGAKGIISCSIRPRNLPNSKTLEAEAVVVKHITSLLPNSELPTTISQLYTGFKLADPEFYKPAPVDFLLGAELFGETLTGNVIAVSRNSPRLFPSIFGHIVMGQSSTSNSRADNNTSLMTLSDENDLHLNLRKFWEIEEPPTIIATNPEEDTCEEHFKTTHYRLPSGQYVVRLPFKHNILPDLSDSLFLASKRFYNMENKIKTNAALKDQYNEFMQEFIDLGHMSLTRSTPKYVIPHHSITKEDRNRIKLRVVFDGSAKTSNGSLNDHLHTGRKLQRDIRLILLNFRAHAYVFVSDIVKMFRRILVDPQDRPFQCIKWRFDPANELETYQVNTVVYGLSSSPFLALRVLQQLEQDEGHNFPLAAKILKRDLFVDDFATGSDSLSIALESQQQLIGLLAKGGFSLSKWASNNQQLLDSVAEESSDDPVSLSSHEETLKILGIEWNPKKDIFSYRINIPPPVLTKRGILSCVSKIFDPLGYLSPTILKLKGFIQELWKEKVSWDQPISDLLTHQWVTIMNELPLLSQVTIPRYVGSTSESQFQIVAFSDASTKGYCATIYL